MGVAHSRQKAMWHQTPVLLHQLWSQWGLTQTDSNDTYCNQQQDRCTSSQERSLWKTRSEYMRTSPTETLLSSSGINILHYAICIAIGPWWSLQTCMRLRDRLSRGSDKRNRTLHWDENVKVGEEKNTIANLFKAKFKLSRLLPRHATKSISRQKRPLWGGRRLTFSRVTVTV